jgi:hypothetical protein
MELMGYLGKQIGVELSPDVLTNIAIGLAIVGGLVLIAVWRGR